MNDEIKLLPLPEPRDLDGARWGYDSDDMSAYGQECAQFARAAVLADREQREASRRAPAVPEQYRDHLLGVCDAVLNPHSINPWGFAKQAAEEAMNWLEATAPTPPVESLAPAVPVYLVNTGWTHDGRETYTRHDQPPPMCDCEVLYAAPTPPVESSAPAVIEERRKVLEIMKAALPPVMEAPAYRTYELGWNSCRDLMLRVLNALGGK